MNATGKVAARAILCSPGAVNGADTGGTNFSVPFTPHNGTISEQDFESSLSLEGGNSTDIILDALSEGIALVPKRAETSNDIKSLRLVLIQRAFGPDPLRRVRRIMMLKAFVMWKNVYPVAQKCDELGRQLQERMSALHTIRESYIRDVLCVKFHVDKLNEATIKNTADAKAKAQLQAETSVQDPSGSTMLSLIEGSESVQDEAQGLHLTPENNMITDNLPSVDLRPLIKRVQDAPHMSSTQLRETMLKAGFIGGASDRVLKPWEQGPTFRNLLKDQKGAKYRMPTGGETISVHAPNKHTLFVNYCQQCTGMMHLVYQWNHEVEDALQAWRERDNKSWESENQNRIAQTINKLNDALLASEMDNKKHLMRIRELEGAGKWFNEWEFAKTAHTDIDHIREQFNQSKVVNAMLKEDNDAMVDHIKLRYEERLEEAAQETHRVNEDLVRVRTQFQIAKRDNADLTAKIAQKDAEAAVAKNELTTVFASLEEERESARVLKHKVEGSTGLFTELTQCLEKKEESFKVYKADTDAKIEDMKAVIASMVTDYDMKEAEVDKLRDEIYEHKQEIRETKSELAQMEAQLEKEVQSSNHRHEHMMKTMTLKKKHSLRRVANVIRHIVHIARRNRIKHSNEKFRARLEYRNSLMESGELSVRGPAMLMRAPSRQVSRLPSRSGSFGNQAELSRPRSASSGIAASASAGDKLELLVENTVAHVDDAQSYLEMMEWSEICELVNMHSSEIDQLHYQHTTLLNENRSLKLQLGNSKFIAQSQRALAVRLEKLVFSLRCSVYVLRKGHDKHHITRKDLSIPSGAHSHALPSGCATGAVTPMHGSLTPMHGGMSRAQSVEALDTGAGVQEGAAGDAVIMDALTEAENDSADSFSSSSSESTFEEDDFFAVFGIAEGNEDEEEEEAPGEAATITSMADVDPAEEPGKKRLRKIIRPVDRLKGHARELTTRIHTWNFTRPLKLFHLHDVTKHFAASASVSDLPANRDMAKENLYHQVLEEERVVNAYCGTVKAEFDKLSDRNSLMLQVHKTLLEQVSTLTEQASLYKEEVTAHKSKVATMQTTINDLEEHVRNVISHVHDFSHSVNGDNASVTSGASRQSSRNSSHGKHHRHGHGRHHRHGSKHSSRPPSLSGTREASRRGSRSLSRRDSTSRSSSSRRSSNALRHDSRSSLRRGNSGKPAPMLRTPQASGVSVASSVDLETQPSSSFEALSTTPKVSASAVEGASTLAPHAAPSSDNQAEAEAPVPVQVPVASSPQANINGNGANVDSDVVSVAASAARSEINPTGSKSGERSVKRRSPSMKSRNSSPPSRSASGRPHRNSSSRPQRAPSSRPASTTAEVEDQVEGQADEDVPADDIDAKIDDFLEKVQALAPSVPLKHNNSSPTESIRKSFGSASSASPSRNGRSSSPARFPSISAIGSPGSAQSNDGIGNDIKSDSDNPLLSARRSPSLDQAMTAISDAVDQFGGDQLDSEGDEDEEEEEEEEYLSDTGSESEGSYDSYEEALRSRKVEMRRSVQRHSIFSMNCIHYLRRHSVIKSIRRMCAEGIAKEVVESKVPVPVPAEAAQLDGEGNPNPIPPTDSLGDGSKGAGGSAYIPIVSAAQQSSFGDSDISNGGLAHFEDRSVSPLSVPAGTASAGEEDPTMNMALLLKEFGGSGSAINAEMTLEELDHQLDVNTQGSFEEDGDSILDEDSIYDDDTASYVEYPRSYRNWKVVILRVFTKIHDAEEAILTKYTYQDLNKHLENLMEQVEELQFADRRSTRALEDQQLELDTLHKDVSKKVIIIRTLQQDLNSLRSEHEELSGSYEESMKENTLLRKGLEDSYRRSTQELTNAADSFAKLQQTEAQMARKRQRNRTTQISCMTCEYKAPTVPYSALDAFNGMSSNKVPICIPATNPATGLLTVDTDRLTPAPVPGGGGGGEDTPYSYIPPAKLPTSGGTGSVPLSALSSRPNSGLPSSAHRYQSQPPSKTPASGVGKILKTFSSTSIGGGGIATLSPNPAQGNKETHHTQPVGTPDNGLHGDQSSSSDFNPIISNADIYGPDAEEKVLVAHSRDINVPQQQHWEYTGVIVDHSGGRENTKILSTAEQGMSLSALTPKGMNYSPHAAQPNVLVMTHAGATSTRRPQSAMASLSRGQGTTATATTGGGGAAGHAGMVTNSNSLPPSAVLLSGANLAGGITGVTGPALIQGTALEPTSPYPKNASNSGTPSPLLSQTMLTSASLSKFTRIKNFPQGGTLAGGAHNAASAPLLSQSQSGQDFANGLVGAPMSSILDNSVSFISEEGGRRLRPTTAGAAGRGSTAGKASKYHYHTDRNPNVSIATRDTVNMDIALTPTAVTIAPSESDHGEHGQGKPKGARSPTRNQPKLSAKKANIKDSVVMSSLIQGDMIKKLGIDLNSAYKVMENHDKKHSASRK